MSIETWGYPAVLDNLRFIFRGHELPLDAKPEDVLFYVDNMKKGSKNPPLWCPTRVQFVGPKCPAEDSVYRLDRITVLFGVIADGRRVVEDITIG